MAWSAGRAWLTGATPQPSPVPALNGFEFVRHLAMSDRAQEPAEHPVGLLMGQFRVMRGLQFFQPRDRIGRQLGDRLRPQRAVAASAARFHAARCS